MKIQKMTHLVQDYREMISILVDFGGFSVAAGTSTATVGLLSLSVSGSRATATGTHTASPAATSA